jgi:hypothetical protein
MATETALTMQALFPSQDKISEDNLMFSKPPSDHNGGVEF